MFDFRCFLNFSNFWTIYSETLLPTRRDIVGHGIFPSRARTRSVVDDAATLANWAREAEICNLSVAILRAGAALQGSGPSRAAPGTERIRIFYGFSFFTFILVVFIPWDQFFWNLGVKLFLKKLFSSKSNNFWKLYYCPAFSTPGEINSIS